MPFELQPTPTGGVPQPAPPPRDDFEPLYAAASDPSIWAQHPESDRYKRDVFENFFKGAIASGGAFAVIDRKTGRIIGSSRYAGYNEPASEIEIGWTVLA